MGHPKFHRSKMERPKKPYDKARLAREKKIIQQFGLRRKHELWKTESKLRGFRSRARDLLSEPNEKIQTELFSRLNKIGVKVSRLEDVLGVDVEALLSRRLQTVLVRRGIAKTQKQSRQLITHNHVIVDGQKVRWPSYLVPVDLEEKIELDQKIKSKMIGAAA